MSFVSRNINKEKFNTTLLIAGSSIDTAYDISGVKVIYLNKTRLLTALPSIMQHIRKLKPQVVISSISHTNLAMSMISPLFKKTKFIGREATILSENNKEANSRRWSPIHLVSNKFKNLDVLLCQSKDMAEDMILNYQVPKEKISIINNPISNLPPIKTISKTTKTKKFITVGRLSEVKGHLRLLEILAQLNYPFKYTIIGEGEYKNLIFEKAKELSILDNIEYIPFTNEVNAYLSKNDMFLQGSFVEGFPNALLESCVVGTPVIAFNVPGGTREIVENNVNGFLVENEIEFLQKLSDNRIWNPKEIRESVYKKFNEGKIIKQYEDLITKTAKQIS
ncbi:glycosyltransferase (GT4) [Formosa agariphila KMM 3901]|uniref:Glycosyltransferase (GT4) n=2 Tax=Formosa TaxID=225842 RepID=T2KNI2_FORAG|nr:glycosyltransferase (GT4) [Formosa agariphila KMM 3901]